jgi:hypothetical protein
LCLSVYGSQFLHFAKCTNFLNIGTIKMHYYYEMLQKQTTAHGIEFSRCQKNEIFVLLFKNH